MQLKFSILCKLKKWMVQTLEKMLKDMVESYKVSKDKYDFFDLNCWLPFTIKDTFYSIKDINNMAKEIEKNRVRKAVITNSESLEYEPFTGNDNLISG